MKRTICVVLVFVLAAAGALAGHTWYPRPDEAYLLVVQELWAYQALWDEDYCEENGEEYMKAEYLAVDLHLMKYAHAKRLARMLREYCDSLGIALYLDINSLIEEGKADEYNQDDPLNFWGRVDGGVLIAFMDLARIGNEILTEGIMYWGDKNWSDFYVMEHKNSAWEILHRDWIGEFEIEIQVG